MALGGVSRGGALGLTLRAQSNANTSWFPYSDEKAEARGCLMVKGGAGIGTWRSSYRVGMGSSCCCPGGGGGKGLSEAGMAQAKALWQRL